MPRLKDRNNSTECFLNPTGFEDGFTIEYVMLSVTVVSTKKSAGQFDDSIAQIVEKHLSEYHGIKSVNAKVLYNHSKIENHPNGCKCGRCSPCQD